MQSLEVISINLWQILISLCNLLILFLIFKKFLFKPVKKMLAERQALIDGRYSEAEKAKDLALASKKQWEDKMQKSEAEANAIIESAKEEAEKLSKATLERTAETADRMIKQAQSDAQLERKKAEDGIKREIVYISTAMTEKLLGREINAKDHRELIDSFITNIGKDSNGDK